MSKSWRAGVFRTSDSESATQETYSNIIFLKLFQPNENIFLYNLPLYPLEQPMMQINGQAEPQIWGFSRPWNHIFEKINSYGSCKNEVSNQRK